MRLDPITLMVLWAACRSCDNEVHWKETYWDVYWLIELVKTGWVGWGSSCLCQFVGCNQKIQISILWIRSLCCDVQHGEQPFMPDDHSDVVPLLPISNRTVKRVSADDSADSRVKVGHRQALTPRHAPVWRLGRFLLLALVAPLTCLMGAYSVATGWFERDA